MIKKTMTAIAAVLCMNSTAYAEETDELSCLVEAVYHEARSESFIGQLAVANVIIERVNLEHFPDTICGVVHSARRWKGKIVKHRCAFSYYCDGKKEWATVNKEALNTAYDAASLAIKGVVVLSTLGATHYHASYVSPKWLLEMRKLEQIGTHIFYTDMR
tara:strand:- start:164 stop:643 length:480 start_codon:yes stop_codon:yes gene_type:complete